MSIARCDDCESLIDCDDDPDAAHDKGFSCAYCRGVEAYDQAVVRQRELYARLRAFTPAYDVDRKTYRGD